MRNLNSDRSARHRVWIAVCKGCQSHASCDAAPELVALEPAEDGVMSAVEAARYVAAFNRTAVAQQRMIRAVALPVAIRYDGDPHPGDRLSAVGVGCRSSDGYGTYEGKPPGTSGNSEAG